MTAVQRIEKGLDREGLMKLNNELDESTAYYRGLIYIEAKKDQQENSALSWEKYLDGFLVDGKQIKRDYANKLIKYAKEVAELNDLENLKKLNTTVSTSLTETEAELKLPDEPSVAIKLQGDNAVQKARLYQEIKEATGKEKPSGVDISQYIAGRNKTKEKMDSFKEKAKIPKIEKPDPFTTEEEIDFETWCIKEHNFDILAERPKGIRTIYALKDEKVSQLFSRLSEWKNAYKEMAKLCHPDKGGNSLAMSFLSDFKELMDSLADIKKIVDYENKVEELREEYSKPKRTR